MEIRHEYNNFMHNLVRGAYAQHGSLIT